MVLEPPDLSLSAPAVTIAKDEAATVSLAWEASMYSASSRDQNPSRFGFFATLPPLDNTEACLKEIALAYDFLQADGVTLLTSYGQSYLGRPVFRDIWDELDQHDAVGFVHPTMDLHQAPWAHLFVPPPLVDYPHETTRTAVHLILSNTIREHPNCKTILSHPGGTLPYMTTRVNCMA